MRRLARTLSLLLILAQPLAAQEPPPQPVTRVFRLQHVRPSAIAVTLDLFRGETVQNDELGTLTVRTMPDVMAAIEEVIATLDVPEIRREAELRVYIVVAREDGSGNDVPDALGNVVRQLAGTFDFDSFELLDTLSVRGFSGDRPRVQGTISSLSSGRNAPDQPSFYNFAGQFEVNGDDPVLRIDDMNMSIRIPVFSGGPGRDVQYIDVGINTDVEIEEGEQVVVGKSTVGDSAVFIVMSAFLPD